MRSVIIRRELENTKNFEIEFFSNYDDLIVRRSFENKAKAKKALKKFGVTRRIDWSKIFDGNCTQIYVAEADE